MRNQNKAGFIFILFCVALFVHGCSTNVTTKETDSIPIKHSPNLVKKAEPVSQITFTAVGDMLIHDRVYYDAATKDGYDFLPMLKEVAPFLGDTTLTFANQETVIGGVELGLSSYPSFNSPVEIGLALKQTGVDIVSIANNHTLDRGEEAIQKSLQHWDEMGMVYVGAYKNDADRDTLRIMETNEGISVGFLAYTYGTNGITVPSGKDFLVNYIDREMIKEDLEKMKDQADVIVVSLHFGNEYERMPSDEQQDLAHFVAEQGADIILGHHPHVLQPTEWIKREDRPPTLVIYSLGNFLSGQDGLYRQIGGILKFTIEKRTENEVPKINIVKPQFMVTYNASEDETNYRVLPMYNVKNDVLPNAAKHYKEMKEHMSQWMPELEFLEPEAAD